MKKLLSILLVIVLCASMSVTVFAANGSMAASSASVAPGGSGTFTVSLTENPGVMAFTVVPNVPAGFSIEMSQAGMSGFWTIIQNAQYDNASDSTYTGPILNVKVTADESVKPGTYSIGFSAQGSNYDEEDIFFGSCSATITVTCDHDMQLTAAEVAPTCTKPGKTAVYTCTKGCGTTEGGDEISVIPHSMKQTAEEVAPTCTVPGKSAVLTCEYGCGTTEGGDVILATGHQNTEIRGAKAENCKDDGYTGDKWCLDCNTKIETGTVIPATGDHKNTEIRDAKAATCKTEGYTGDTYCVDCGEKIETGTVIPVDPDAHTPGEAVRENEVKGDCKTKGQHDEVVYCSECGKELDRKTIIGELGGHNYGTDGKCTICGKVKDPNLDKQPDTGDIFVEIALYASFAALAVGAVVYAKRKVRG